MFLTQPDRDRLVTLLRTQHAPRSLGNARSELQTTLTIAAIVPSSQVPGTVVTMNSIVNLIDLTTGMIATYTLVYPSEANVDGLKISVFAPLGAALLGRSEGEVIEFAVPAGTKRYFLQKVLYQPEARLHPMTSSPVAA